MHTFYFHWFGSFNYCYKNTKIETIFEVCGGGCDCGYGYNKIKENWRKCADLNIWHENEYVKKGSNLLTICPKYNYYIPTTHIAHHLPQCQQRLSISKLNGYSFCPYFTYEFSN